jgi:hypothetical protein
VQKSILYVRLWPLRVKNHASSLPEGIQQNQIRSIDRETPQRKRAKVEFSGRSNRLVLDLSSQNILQRGKVQQLAVSVQKSRRILEE